MTINFILNTVLIISHSAFYFIIIVTLLVTNLVPLVQMRKLALESLASKHQK